MVLKTILLTRHGFRANWFDEPAPLHPSGLEPPDTPLSAHGLLQAQELSHFLTPQQPHITGIYSSPWYRCIQTVEPLASALHVRIIPEPGLGEWYGLNRTDDPTPATAAELQNFYAGIEPEHQSLFVPAVTGESIEELYERSAYVLSRLIKQLDEDPSGPESVVLCTHAASLVAFSRVLAGNVPSDPSTQDFIAYTACVTRFERQDAVPVKVLPKPVASSRKLQSDWLNEHARGGRWRCVLNGYSGYLSSGRQRGWRFSGKESFDHKVQAHGLDAGTGLGVVLPDESPQGHGVSQL
ncbi:C6 zinc cluster transcription factor-like protein [Oleoguttula sp. CCFEE 5521]